MIIQILDILDLGTLAKQRICFEVTKNGNLRGHYLYQGDYIFYIFPSCVVKKGDYVVLYVSPGDNHRQVFRRIKCYFLYYGEWIHLWEEQKKTFRLVYRRFS